MKFSSSSPQTPPLTISLRLSTSADHPTSAKSSPTSTSALVSRHMKRSLVYNCTRCKTCPIHIPTQSFTSSNTSLTYPITTLAFCKSSNLLYQLQCKKYNVFYIGSHVLKLCIWAPVNWHVRALWPTVPSIANPISWLSRNAGPSVSFTNSWTISTANLKWLVNLSVSPANSSVSTFDI